MRLGDILDRMIGGEYMRKKEMDIETSYRFHEGDIIVIGCSGGIDSMALLHMLLELRKTMSLSLICAHVNHNVRKESQEEFTFVRDFCRDHDVVFEGMMIEKYGDDNFHNEARNIRYHFFEEVVQKYQANYLVTAHHADDLMETILMRLVRGSTLKGYAGFEKVVEKDHYLLVRPLIMYTKEELIDYVRRHHVPYREDSSNHKMNYTRNRYRKYVLPFLKQEDKSVHKKFLKFSTLLQDADHFIQIQAKTALHQVFQNGQLNIELYQALEPFLQKMVLYSILEQLYQDDLILISNQHVLLLDNLIHSKKANASVSLPNEKLAIKSYQTIFFPKQIDQISSYEIELTKFVSLPNHRHLTLTDDDTGTGNDVCRLDSKECTLPLTVRTRRLGDRMYLKGTNGRKKLKDIFIDKKIPLDERDLWPVVVDAKGEIVWLPGLQKSKFDKKKTESYDIIIKYH